jgi:hypothetical protein
VKIYKALFSSIIVTSISYFPKLSVMACLLSSSYACHANTLISRPCSVPTVEGESENNYVLPNRPLQEYSTTVTCRAAHQDTLNFTLFKSMAHRSLLRHIFRHGPHSKARTTESPPKASDHVPDNIIAALSESVSHQQLMVINDVPKSPLAYKTCSESRGSSVLEVIVEESEYSAEEMEYSAEEKEYSGDDNEYGRDEIEYERDEIEYERDEIEYSGEESCSDVDKASVAETCSALDLSIDTFTTRELVTAALSEAKTITYDHLDTITMTLALLEALEGFSATITALREEMVTKKQTCEEKLTMLEEIEGAVEHMQFGTEDREEV